MPDRGQADYTETRVEGRLAARRELVEECGYEAAQWRYISTLHPCIGYSNERMEFFVANELRHVGRRLDEGEFLDVVPMKLESALERVWCGDITDIKTVAGLLWLKSAPAALIST